MSGLGYSHHLFTNGWGEPNDLNKLWVVNGQDGTLLNRYNNGHEESYEQKEWAYAMAFYESDGTTGNTNVQKVINGESTDLKKANDAYYSYAKNADKVLSITGDDLTIDFYEDYYKIGPFETNDYAYYKSDEVEKFSGKGLVQPDMLGGIIGGEVKLNGASGTRNATIEIGEEGDDVYISGDLYDGKFPQNNSKFYVMVKKSIFSHDKKYNKLDFNFKYRKTEASGSSVVCAYAKKFWEDVNDVDNPYTESWKQLIIPSNAKVEVSATNVKVDYSFSKTDVSINQYISKVENGRVQYLQEDENVWKLKGTADRGGWTNDNKKEKPVILESGDEVELIITVTNNTDKRSRVSFSDIVPKCFDVTDSDGGIVSENYDPSRAVGDVYNVIGNPFIEWTEEIEGKESITKSIKANVNASAGDYNFNAGKPLHAVAVVEDVYVDNIPAGYNESDDEISADYVIAKKYNVNVDTYITEVKSKENVVYDASSGSKNYRGGKSNKDKHDDFVKIENGDEVTYEIVVTNGASEDAPYYNPSPVKAEIKFVADFEYTDMKIDGKDPEFNNNGNIELDTLINGGVKTLIVTVTVTDIPKSAPLNDDNYTRKFTTEIYSITNKHDRTYKNDGRLDEDNQIKDDAENSYTNAARSGKGLLSSSDYFICKKYNVNVKTYLSTVEGIEVSGKNITNGRDKMSDTTKKDNPQKIENGDTLQYTIVVTNESGENSPCYDPDPVNVTVKIPEIPNYSFINTGTSAGKTARVHKNGNYFRQIDIKGLRSEDGDNQVYITVDLVVTDPPIGGAGDNAIRPFTAEIIVGNRNSIIQDDKNADDAYAIQGTDFTTSSEDSKKKIVNIGTATSTDYILCKKYNVSLDTYISKISRKDGTSVATYTAQNRDKNTPVYAENGDIIEYTIVVKNNAKNDDTESPCYNPDAVSVLLEWNIPIGATEMQTIEKTGDNIVYDLDNRKILITDFKNGDEKTIKVTLCNNNTENGDAYDYNTLRTFNIRVSRLGNKHSSAYKTNVAMGYNFTTDSTSDSNTENDNDDEKDYNGYDEAQKKANKKVINISDNTKPSDDYRIKEYNVVVDKYIQKVEHTDNRGGTKITYDSDGRIIDITDPVVTTNSDGTVTFNNKGGEGKHDDQVLVESGDKVTYKIVVYNTTDSEYYNVNRTGAPYHNPDYVVVNLTDILPQKYNNLSVSIPVSVSADKKTFDVSNLKIPAGGTVEFTVDLKVEEVIKNTLETNTINLVKGSETNINGYHVVNEGNRYKAEDTYKLNDYDLELQEYVNTYNHEMLDYNNAHNFTDNESSQTGENNVLTESRFNKTLQEKRNKPFDAEKYETLILETRITNNSTGAEVEDSKDSYKDYNTRIVPDKIKEKLDSGLEYQSHEVKWFDSEGNLKKNIYGSIEKVPDPNDAVAFIYQIKSGVTNIVLNPGDYVIYYTKVKVIESNMCTENLFGHSEILELTNVNYRVVEEGCAESDKNQNISLRQQDEDYVRLKDLIIAGKVFVDNDRRNGKDENENNTSTVKAVLYGNNGDADNFEQVGESVTVGADGFYSFGRQWKKTPKDIYGNYTSDAQQISYYVEFEYDGVMYKATEVYGGVNTGQTNGKGNLESDGGGANWRQGYEDLPDAKSGSEAYMTDSNSYEFDSTRNGFDEQFTVIGYNKGYDSEINLNYNKSGHKSDLIEDASRVMRARSFITQDYTNEAGVEESYDNTNKLFLYDYEGHHNTMPETEYLKFINLGLVKREEVDVSIEADVYSLKNTIKAEEMEEIKNKNYADSTASNYDSQTNAYKYTQNYNYKYYTENYYYRHDTTYENEENQAYEGEESELVTEITYKIRLNNNKIPNDEPNMPTTEIPIETAFNEVAIYYDNKFMSSGSINVRQKNDEGLLENDRNIPYVSVKYGTEDNMSSENINISTSSAYGSEYEEDKLDKFNVLYLSGDALSNTHVAEGENRYIEITFVVDKEDRDLKLGDFDLVAEVSAYSTWYADKYKDDAGIKQSAAHRGLVNHPAGLVDRDSNSGNVLDDNNGILNYDEYEDDTYKVGIKTEVSEMIDEADGTGIITGFTWEDTRSKNIDYESSDDEEDNKGTQYVGNGEFDENDETNNSANKNPNKDNPTDTENDKKIGGIKVTLIEVIQHEDGKYHEEIARRSDANGVSDITAITEDDGSYKLFGITTGRYKVRFDYGSDVTREDNIIYNGQDYKSTAYYNPAPGYYGSDWNNNDNISEDSVSKNDYYDRVKGQLEEENYSDAQDDEIRRLNVNSYSETMTTTQAQVFSQLEAKKDNLINNTQMYAESTIFYVKPENVKSAVKVIGEDERASWELNNVDFGLEYRPEASIILESDIDSIKIVSSDKTTKIVDLYFDENGSEVDTTKSVGQENVQFIQNDDDKTTQGFVNINMDTDLLVGSTVQVKYKLSSRNEGEVDRINQNLDDIKYENNASDKKVYVSASNRVINDNDTTRYNYSANGTAAQILADEYYAYTSGSYLELSGNSVKEENIDYLKKIKKPYYEGTNEGYYGMYLGETYYTGSVGTNDKVVDLKVDNILSYVDNNLVFNSSENNTRNQTWTATTSQGLVKSVLDENKVNILEVADKKYLIDKNELRYDIGSLSNLALSVDTYRKGRSASEIKGNESLSRFLKPKNSVNDENKKTEYTGEIQLYTSKVLSEKDIENDETAGVSRLVFNNISDIVQYTSMTGRKTTLPYTKQTANGDRISGGIIGEANTNINDESKTIKGLRGLSDPEYMAEEIIITPPTGVKD